MAFDFTIARADPETQRCRLLVLEKKGWKRLGKDHWISPYGGYRFDLRAALDVELLRGSFHKRGWKDVFE